MQMTDQMAGWLDAVKLGDQTAASKLLAVYHPQLRLRVRSRLEPALRVKHEPEDILQQAYLQVLRELNTFQGETPESFLGWVNAICDHKVIDARRSAHRQVRDIDREQSVHSGGENQNDSYWNLLDYIYDDAGTPSRIIRREEAVGALLASLSSLSEEHRQIIQLRFLQGLPVNEVAGHLDKTDAAVVAMTKRALESLRRAMQLMGDFSRGG